MSSKRIVLLCLLTIEFVSSIQVMFDSFNSCNSSGMFECNVRVHKLNRTTAALIGNLVQHVDIGESFDTSIEFYHSPLGNNQFNKHWMKIGPINMCVYMDNYWGDYYPFIVKYIPNVAKVGECPVKARTFPVNDWILDARMFPLVVPPGLWKMLWGAQESSGKHYFVAEFVFKVFTDGYF